MFKQHSLSYKWLIYRKSGDTETFSEFNVQSESHGGVLMQTGQC